MKKGIVFILSLIVVTALVHCQRESRPVGPGGHADPIPWGEWKQYSAGGGMYSYQGWVKNGGYRRADSCRVILSWPEMGISDSGYVNGMMFITTGNETSFASLDPDQIASFEVETYGQGEGWRVNLRWAELEGTVFK